MRLALSIDPSALCRALTGMGIGGECGAVNSAIDELLPARVRGFADIAINGTFWLGAAAGAAVSLLLLAPSVLGPVYGWRVAFGLGAAVGLAVLLVRRRVPESPRWLLMHGRVDEAERVVRDIEAEARMPSADKERACGVSRFHKSNRSSEIVVATIPLRPSLATPVSLPPCSRVRLVPFAAVGAIVALVLSARASPRAGKAQESALRGGDLVALAQ